MSDYNHWCAQCDHLCRGCPVGMELRPPKGATYETEIVTSSLNGKKVTYERYHVVECTHFLPDQKHDYRELDDHGCARLLTAYLTLAMKDYYTALCKSHKAHERGREDYIALDTMKQCEQLLRRKIIERIRNYARQTGFDRKALKSMRLTYEVATQA